MKIDMTLSVPTAFIYQQLVASIQADIRQATGQTVPTEQLEGFAYKKKWQNGMIGQLKITAAQVNQRYAYELETNRDRYTVDYQFASPDQQTTSLQYAETIAGKSDKGQANNRAVGLLLGWLRKRRFKKMMTAMAAEYMQ